MKTSPNIWALADLHLSFGTPNKQMDVFGNQWVKHYEKIEKHWRETISSDDLVLLAGDISWGMKPEEAIPDLEWIDRLPGTKVMIKGNHDYWWESLSKVKNICPASIHAIQHNVFKWEEGIEVGGTRLWDTSEYHFNGFVEMKSFPQVKEKPLPPKETETIFVRELHRLELSLKEFSEDAKQRIIMTHYPPIGPDLKSSRASGLLEKYGVNICVFGHLHNVKPNSLPFGKARGINYYLTSADYLDFIPKKIECESLHKYE